MAEYLNVGNDWPHTQLFGLVRDEDGALRLAGVPGDPRALGDALEHIGVLETLAGMAVDRWGNVYLSDPESNRILRYDACGEQAPFACWHRAGAEPGFLRGPHGLAVGPRDVLIIADTGNARIQVVDLATGQLVGVWDQFDATFDQQPLDVAVDAAGQVYLLDVGGRIRRFDIDEHEDAAWPGVRITPDVMRAQAIAIAAREGGERLLVVGTNPARLLVYGLDGVLDAVATQDWTAFVDLVGNPLSVAAFGDRVYVADRERRRLLVFDAAGRFLGFAGGLQDGFVGVGVEGTGRVVAVSGAGIRRFEVAGQYLTEGLCLIGPIQTEVQERRWFRVSLDVESAQGAVVQGFTLTSAATAMPGIPTPGDAERAFGPALTDRDAWRAVPAGRRSFLVLNEVPEAGRTYLWIAVLLRGNGRTSPRLRQVRLDRASETWMEQLPRVYRKLDERASVERVVALLETAMEDTVAPADRFSRRLDPWVTPNGPPRPSWLEWLGGWVAAELEAWWPDAWRRRVVARAFRRHSRRGTVQGLKASVRDVLGPGAFVSVIDSGRAPAAWWLGVEGTALGFATALPAGVLGGAALDYTAVLDASQLADDQECRPDAGAPESSVCVRVLAAQLRHPEALRTLERTVTREVPAHLEAHLCLIRPDWRVGLQATIGVDTIIGDSAPFCVPGAVLSESVTGETDSGVATVAVAHRIGVDTTLT